MYVEDGEVIDWVKDIMKVVGVVDIISIGEVLV